MYRKIVPFVILACGSLSSFGQAPTLTAANYNPAVGDRFISVVCKNAGVDPGTSGPSVTWNFGGLTTVQTDTAAAVTVASTAAGSGFVATSNIAVTTPTASMTTYYNQSSGKVSVTGYYQSLTQNAVYSDPMDLLQFPFDYNGTFTDPYAGYITIGGATFHGSGSVTTTYDGWGTLTLPGGKNFTGVVRVHSSQNFVDSADLFLLGTDATFDLESYNWYQPGYHSALLTISTTSGTGAAAGYADTVVSYAAKDVTRVPEISAIDQSLQLFPNPVKNELNITFNAASGGQVRVSMFDMFGREVAVIANQYALGTQNISYNTGNLPKGLYIVRFESAGDAVARQVVVD
jgi:type IX secretion system substrate protein